MKKNNIIQKLTKKIPLKTHIQVLNEMAFINLIVELGYRKDTYWTDDEDELLTKLMKLAKKHTNDIIKQIENFN